MVAADFFFSGLCCEHWTCASLIVLNCDLMFASTDFISSSRQGCRCRYLYNELVGTQWRLGRGRWVRSPEGCAASAIRARHRARTWCRGPSARGAQSLRCARPTSWLPRAGGNAARGGHGRSLLETARAPTPARNLRDGGKSQRARLVCKGLATH
ncbi:hypothetical protein C8R47DRAFT_262700 [Mycena vitilis]|nr:hypothetical protein C8R47DRAFT_262700 [Mycena vitilis]